MPRIAKAVGAVIAALFCLLALGQTARAAEGVLPADMTMGNPAAKVTVIEYASDTCPHCAAFNAEVFPAFKAKYIDTGKVLYVFREFPTEPAQLSAAGFLIARCAAPGSYFAVIDALFKGQAALFKSSDARAFLLNAGKAGGLDEAKITTCLNDKTALDAFSARVKAAVEDAHIDGTPTFVIGKAKLVGEQTLDQLDAAIQPMLAAR